MIFRSLDVQKLPNKFLIIFEEAIKSLVISEDDVDSVEYLEKSTEIGLI